MVYWLDICGSLRLAPLEHWRCLPSSSAGTGRDVRYPTDAGTTKATGPPTKLEACNARRCIQHTTKIHTHTFHRRLNRQDEPVDITFVRERWQSDAWVEDQRIAVLSRCEPIASQGRGLQPKAIFLARLAEHPQHEHVECKHWIMEREHDLI